jgi:hypothetical protein
LAYLDAKVSLTALASTALSTANWTNTLATNLGSTNSTVATNLDAKVSLTALAATALSTANWTNTLATNLGTTNSTVATNLDGKISAVPTAAQNADAVLDELLSGHTTAGSLGKTVSTINTNTTGISGAGATSITLTITENGLAGGTKVADADVWLSSDSAGLVVVAGTKQTNASGQVTFLLDVGSTYYLWAQKDGWQGIQGTSFVAAA